MSDKVKLEITIKTQSEEEKMEVGTRIHEQLRGNPDYVNNNIILNIDAENEVWLGIFKECENVPKITI